MSFGEFLRFIRFKYNITIFTVFISFFMFTPFSLSNLMFVCIAAAVFIVFYSGIYIFNDIIDYDSDMHNPNKLKSSPLLQQKISRKGAAFIAILFLLSGLLISFWIHRLLPFFLLLFLVFNILYTFWFKHIAFVELIANAFTHFMRFFMGAALANTGAVFTTPVIVCAFVVLFTGITIASTKRQFELLNKGKKSIRKTLKYYTNPRLFAVKLLALALTIAAIIFFPNLVFLLAIGLAVQLYDIFGMNGNAVYSDSLKKLWR
jgi:4-hydroxybenzoate polyprenyltransferase